MKLPVNMLVLNAFLSSAVINPLSLNYIMYQIILHHSLIVPGDHFFFTQLDVGQII